MNIKNFFRQTGLNLILILMLTSLCILTFNNEIKSVFAPNSDNLYYKGDISKNNISLMINVYWGNEYLPNMLQTLEEYNIRTTFFIGGMWASKYPEELLKIHSQNHEIANHGYFHKDHNNLSYEDNQKEIMNTHNIIKEYTSLNMTLFAPPSGSFNDYTLQVAQNLGYKVIMWSKDTIDWRDQDVDLIYKRATSKLSNGDLILMHPTLCTALALPKIIEYCQQNNFNIVPVSNVIN